MQTGKYLEIKLERAAKRKQERKDRRKQKKNIWGPYKAWCSECGSLMHWCSICEAHTATCCSDWGSCLCS